jgi:hypothetical protein
VERRRDDFLTLTELRDRGWTPAMTRDLLGKEDLQRRNPFYRTAAPVLLWALEAHPRLASECERQRHRRADGPLPWEV